MILCIGLIVAIYVVTRLGLEGVNNLVRFPYKVEALIKICSAGMVLGAAGCMVLLYFFGGESMVDELLRF